MEFLLQLIAELFGSETITESENVVTTSSQSIVELENAPIIEKQEELEEDLNFFGVIQFL